MKTLKKLCEIQEKWNRNYSRLTYLAILVMTVFISTNKVIMIASVPITQWVSAHYPWFSFMGFSTYHSWWGFTNLQRWINWDAMKFINDQNRCLCYSSILQDWWLAFERCGWISWQFLDTYSSIKQTGQNALIIGEVWGRCDYENLLRRRYFLENNWTAWWTTLGKDTIINLFKTKRTHTLYAMPLKKSLIIIKTCSRRF